MLRLLLLPAGCLAALLLITGRFGGTALPHFVAGLPTPMILFVGITAFVLVNLRTA